MDECSGVSCRVLLAATAMLIGLERAGADDTERELRTTIDLTYASRYIWHGIDMLPDDDGAFQPSVSVSYGEFAAALWASASDQGGHEKQDEVDFCLGYGHSFFAEERHALRFDVGYTYFAFPNTNSDADGQELALSLAAPQLLPFGVVPAYSAYYIRDGVQAHTKVEDGWFHTLALSREVPVAGQAVTLTSDVSYQDGVFGYRPAWTHATFGVATTFLYKGFQITPKVCWQSTFDDDTVNDEDEFYALLSVGFSF